MTDADIEVVRDALAGTLARDVDPFAALSRIREAWDEREGAGLSVDHLQDELVMMSQALAKAEQERDEAVSLLEREHRNALLVLWAVVMAAGGEVRVTNALLVESDGDLHRFPHPALGGEVFRATHRATPSQEKKK